MRAMPGLLLLFAMNPAIAACDAPEHRQFDFWIGEWDVVGGVGSPMEGKRQGHNTIARAAAGCALTEHWRGASGLEGHSLNAWDATASRWRQFWVGGDGLVLRLEGGLQDRSMLMHGELPTAGGKRQRQRIRWTPQPDGSVVQRWDTSDDDGASWQASFVGHYRRADPAR